MQEVVKEELAGFDPLAPQKRDPKTGKITKVEHFTMIAHKGVRFYEWPKGSKNLWFENRTFAGRRGEDGFPVKGEKHIAFVPVMTKDQTIGAQNTVLETENARLMQELTAIKKEQDMNAKLAAPVAVSKVTKGPVKKQ